MALGAVRQFVYRRRRTRGHPLGRSWSSRWDLRRRLNSTRSPPPALESSSELAYPVVLVLHVVSPEVDRRTILVLAAFGYKPRLSRAIWMRCTARRASSHESVPTTMSSTQRLYRSFCPSNVNSSSRGRRYKWASTLLTSNASWGRPPTRDGRYAAIGENTWNMIQEDEISPRPKRELSCTNEHTSDTWTEREEVGNIAFNEPLMICVDYPKLTIATQPRSKPPALNQRGRIVILVSRVRPPESRPRGTTL